MVSLLPILFSLVGTTPSAAVPRYPSNPPYAWPGPITPQDLLPFDSTETAAFARLGVTRIESRRSDEPTMIVVYTLNKAGQAVREEGLETKGKRTRQTYDQVFTYDRQGRLQSRVQTIQNQVDNYDSLWYDPLGRLVRYDVWLSPGPKQLRRGAMGLFNRTTVLWRPDGTGRAYEHSPTKGSRAAPPTSAADTTVIAGDYATKRMELRTDAQGKVVFVHSGTRIDSIAADVVTDTAVIQRTWYRLVEQAQPSLGREVVFKAGTLRSITLYVPQWLNAIGYQQAYSYDEHGRLLRVEEGNGTISTTFSYYANGLWAAVVRVDSVSVAVTRYTYFFGRP